MDSDVPEEVEPRRSGRRRRRHRNRREEEAAPAAAVDVLSIVRQLAGLAIFGIFFLLVLAAPLPMGGNRDWAWAPMAIVIGVLGVLCATGLGGREALKVSAEERVPLLVLVACFLLFITWALFQMSPLAPLSGSAPYYARAGEILGQTLAPIPSLSADASRDALLKCGACGVIFLVARVLFRDPQWARLLLIVFAVSAVAVIVYAVYMSVTTHNCYVGSYLKKAGSYMVQNDRCLASGTFVGSNNFGCFCGMALVAALSLLSDGRRPPRGTDPEYDDEEESTASMIAAWLSGPKFIVLALALFCVGGLLLSASRAGAAATFASILILGYLLMRGASRKARGGLTVIAVVVGMMILVLAGGAMLHKLSLMADSGNLSRVVIWKASLAAVRESPWFGWGLGSYADIYAINQPLAITLPNDKAHSTPLEFIVELGVPGSIPALAVCLIPWGYCLAGALSRRRQRYLPAAAFAVSAVAILHSTVDFSLQIPGIAFVVSALLGLGWAQTFGPPDEPERSFASGI